jgi:uncharacterized protein YutE (UPF0331/DUF86 family)
MLHDPLINKAVLLRESAKRLNISTEHSADGFYLSDKPVAIELESACRTCEEMGRYFINENHWGNSKNTLDIFQKLVDHHVIDAKLSKRMLSLISFGKLLRHASELKGKNCRIVLRSQQIKDFHVFTQNLLLS